MQIVIDISEDVYTRLFDNGIQDNEIAVDDVCEMARAIRLGTPFSEDVAHWIVHPKGIYSHLVCSNCLSCAPYDCKTNYCPNCGRKMEAEHDEGRRD